MYENWGQWYGTKGWCGKVGWEKVGERNMEEGWEEEEEKEEEEEEKEEEKSRRSKSPEGNARLGRRVGA